jgi:2-methylcitrate dehydratase
MRVMAGDEEKWRPSSRETADHSLPYVVAVALTYGNVAIKHFGPDFLHDGAHRDLLPRIDVTVDPRCEESWPAHMLAGVEIWLTDGRHEARWIRDYRGHPGNPLSDEEIEEKFSALSGPYLDRSAQRELISTVWRLDEAPDVTAFVQATRHTR